MAGMDGTDRNEVVISDRAKVVRTNRHQRLGSPRGRNEFHAERIGPVDLDDRAQVAPAQPMSRQVASQHDGVERMNGHFRIARIVKSCPSEIDSPGAASCVRC